MGAVSEVEDGIVELEIRRFNPGLEADFQRLMDGDEGCSWCRRVAWWVPSWEGFSDRSAADNRQLREKLLAHGEYDGYLAFRDGECVGWCQVGPRDRLPKLAQEHELPPDPDSFAITCFYVPKGERRRGVSRALLRGVLVDLDARSVKRVEAFPRSEGALASGELWTGPRSLFAQNGFYKQGTSGRRILMVRELPGR